MIRLRVPLLTLAACAVAGAVLFWDVQRRAAESIEAHRREVDATFSQGQDQRRGRPPVFDPPAPGNAWDAYAAALKEIHDSPGNQAYILSNNLKLDDPAEELAAQQGVLDRLRAAFRQPATPSTDPEKFTEHTLGILRYLTEIAERLAANGRDRASMDVLIVVFALGQDYIRFGTEEFASQSFLFLTFGAMAGLRALDGHGLGSADLDVLCASFDQLAPTRPTLSQTIEWGRLEWKRVTLSQALPDEALLKERTWKDFGSRTLFHARVLSEIDAHHLANAEWGRRPSWERVKPNPRALETCAAAAEYFNTHFCCVSDLDYHKEVDALEHLALLRIAMALAWHEAEKGKPAASLQALLPRYLKEVPVSPLDGKPFGYADGVLSSRDLKGKVSEWRVTRR
ncbi:MAG TPA: hypothetical protein VF950_18390 [Planctomycetota bacterium]